MYYKQAPVIFALRTSRGVGEILAQAIGRGKKREHGGGAEGGAGTFAPADRSGDHGQTSRAGAQKELEVKGEAGFTPHTRGVKCTGDNF